MNIPLDKAEIIALFVECILYGTQTDISFSDQLTQIMQGVFIVTFLACLYILIPRRKTEHVNLLMVVTAVLLFICSTMHVSIDLARLIFAFYTHRDAPGGPVSYLENIRSVTHVLKTAVYVTETCISDALVV